jgi:hypothetical protein
MNYTTFIEYAKQILTPPLQQRGYILVAYPSLERSVVFRKQRPPWFIYINVQYSRHSSSQSSWFDVHTTRMLVDNPFGQYIRDQQGKYIPGSLVGAVSPPSKDDRSFTSPDELSMQLHALLPALFEEIARLEDPDSSMHYE